MSVYVELDRKYYLSVFAHQSPNISDLVQKGTPQKFGSNRGGVPVLNRKPAIYLKRGKIGPKLLLMINSRLHTRFRLEPNKRPCMTLNGPVVISRGNAWDAVPIVKNLQERMGTAFPLLKRRGTHGNAAVDRQPCVFTRDARIVLARYCYRKSYVRPSVCL